MRSASLALIPDELIRLSVPPPFTQNPEERAHAEQYLRVFGQSIEYIAHCKVATATRYVQDDRLSVNKANSTPCISKSGCRVSGDTLDRRLSVPLEIDAGSA